MGIFFYAQYHLTTRVKKIAVPQRVSDRHFLPGDLRFTAENVKNFTYRRSNMPIVNTVFESTKLLYYYPIINLTVSELPLKAYHVNTKHRKAAYMGLRWAIFSGQPPKFHFESKCLKISSEVTDSDDGGRIYPSKRNCESLEAFCSNYQEMKRPKIRLYSAVC